MNRAATTLRRDLIGLTLLSLAIVTLHLPAPAQQFQPRLDTWLALPPNEQLYREGLDDRKGMGRIFVPAMTTPANEPLYAVFHDGELLGEKLMGSSFFLAPGHYTVILGTGTLEQRIHREVDVPREATVIIEPSWCSLTVEVIDESRNNFPQDLQTFGVTTGESFGILPAINPELGQQLQTLILQPGLYKIVKRGQDFNTFVDFATVLLEAGAYTPFTVVINSVTRGFTGAGILTRATQLRRLRYWKVFAAVHGNVILTSKNSESAREVGTDLSLLTQFENRLLFDHFPHYYLSSNLLDIGALKQHRAQFVINRDRLQFKNTYVYFLLNWLGGYGRLEVSTHMLPSILLFDPPRSIILQDPDGRTLDTVNVSRFEAAPALYPLAMKEGVGVNITPVKRFNARLSLRSGLGFRQSYNHQVYRQSEKVDTLYQRSPDSHLRGLETSLVTNFAFFQNLVITTELDVLFPFEDIGRPVTDLENFVSLGVSKHITIEHTLRLQRHPADFDYIYQEQLVSIRLSYFLF